MPGRGERGLSSVLSSQHRQAAATAPLESRGAGRGPALHVGTKRGLPQLPLGCSPGTLVCSEELLPVEGAAGGPLQGAGVAGEGSYLRRQRHGSAPLSFYMNPNRKSLALKGCSPGREGLWLLPGTSLREHLPRSRTAPARCNLLLGVDSNN